MEPSFRLRSTSYYHSPLQSPNLLCFFDQESEFGTSLQQNSQFQNKKHSGFLPVFPINNVLSTDKLLVFWSTWTELGTNIWHIGFCASTFAGMRISCCGVPLHNGVCFAAAAKRNRSSYASRLFSSCKIRSFDNNFSSSLSTPK